MKLLKKVKPIEVKRTFVVSDRNKRIKLTQAKKSVLKLTEAQLNRILLRKNKSKRLSSYNAADWYVGMAKIGDVGVWRGAGNIPLAWTRGSLKDTAARVSAALKAGKLISPSRAQTAIPGIIKNSLVKIQREKYLLPIILPGGSIPRKGLKRMKGDIDDGCMRSIALAISGRKEIKAYIGVKRK